MKASLSAQQRRFVDELEADPSDPVGAARRAGYSASSPDTLRVAVSRALRHVGVRAEMARRGVAVKKAARPRPRARTTPTPPPSAVDPRSVLEAIINDPATSSTARLRGVEALSRLGPGEDVARLLREIPPEVISEIEAAVASGGVFLTLSLAGRFDDGIGFKPVWTLRAPGRPAHFHACRGDREHCGKTVECVVSHAMALGKDRFVDVLDALHAVMDEDPLLLEAARAAFGDDEP